MADQYEIPEWLKSELDPDALAKLQHVAGEHKLKAVSEPAKALKHAVDAVVAALRDGDGGDASALDAAFRDFRSAAFPAAPVAARAPRASGAATSNGAARQRDSKQEVAIWKFSTAVVKAAGYDQIGQARTAGYDTKGLREAVVAEITAGRPLAAEGEDPRVAEFAARFVGQVAPVVPAASA